MDELIKLLESITTGIKTVDDRLQSAEDRIRELEQGNGGGGNGGGINAEAWQLLSAPVHFSGDDGSVVILKNGEEIEVNGRLNAVLSGAGFSVRFDPESSIPGGWEDVLEIAVKDVQQLLKARWSGYMRWNVGAAYTFQGSGGKRITRASVGLLAPWGDDGVRVGFRFDNPELTAKEGETTVDILGERPLTCRMNWFMPPWHVAKGDIFAATFSL